MMVVDAVTGQKANFGSKKTIIEAFKTKTSIDNKNNKDFDINNRLKNNNILKFY
jgi:penicillin-binding protein 1A